MTTLIIGGTSGLGLELAKKFAKTGSDIIVTGRCDPKVKELQFYKFDLSGSNLARRINKFVEKLPNEASLLVSSMLQAHLRV